MALRTGLVPEAGYIAAEMQFITRQARPSDISETDACGLGPRDKLLDWLIARREDATEASVSASLPGLRSPMKARCTTQPVSCCIARSIGSRRLAIALRDTTLRPAVPGELMGCTSLGTQEGAGAEPA